MSLSLSSSFSVSLLLTSISRSSVFVCPPFGKAKGRCAHRDEGDSSPISFRQREGRVPPGTSTQLHLRGPCYGRRICSFACKSLPGPLRLPPYTGAHKHWRLINMKGIRPPLQTCVKDCDFLSECYINHMCPGAWEHRDDIP